MSFFHSSTLRGKCYKGLQCDTRLRRSCLPNWPPPWLLHFRILILISMEKFQLTFVQMCVTTEHMGNFCAFQFMSLQNMILKPMIYVMFKFFNYPAHYLSGRTSLLSLPKKATTRGGQISSQFSQEHQSILCPVTPGVVDGLPKIYHPSQAEQPASGKLTAYLLTRKTSISIDFQLPTSFVYSVRKIQGSFWSQNGAYRYDGDKAQLLLGRNLHKYCRDLKTLLVLLPACLSHSYCFALHHHNPSRIHLLFLDWLPGLKQSFTAIV